MPTIRDVAKIAGTSVSAVSAVLNGGGRQTIRVGEATQERIRAAAREVGYTTNRVAQSLVTGRSGVLGLVFPYSSAFIDNNPFSVMALSGVMAAAVTARWNLMLHTATGDDWNAADDKALIDPRVDGLILVLPTPHSPVIARCQREKFPCVALVYQPDSPDLCAVNSDDFNGGKLATEHLITLGHRRIAHLSGGPTVATSAPRQAGYLSALQEAGIPAEAGLIQRADFTTPGGHAAMRRLLERDAAEWPTAVFAANDLSAQGALQAIQERGLRVPDDISLVGYDDSWLATMTQPPLTSVKMPIYEMSIKATEILVALIEKKEIPQRQPVLPISLTIRDSCGARSPRLSSQEENNQ